MQRTRIRAAALREALAKRTLSQNAWALRIGLSSSHLSMLLSGERRYPNEETRRKLLAHLDVSFHQLFDVEVVEHPRARQSRIRRTIRSILSSVPALLDPRPALRPLRRRFGFAALVTVVLAIGMGSTTAIFSIVDAVLIRPLPFDHSDRLVAVWQTYPNWQGDPVLDDFWDHIPLSYPEYTDWRTAQTSFDDVALYAATSRTLMTGDRPVPVTLGVASRSFFPLLGISPLMGHGLESAEAGDETRLALVSHQLWRDHFSADSTIVGKTIRLDQTLFQVVGVLPAGFGFRQRFLRGTSNRADLWTLAESLPGMIRDRGNRGFSALGRLRAEVGLGTAQSESEVLLRGERVPEEKSARLSPLLEEWTRDSRSALIALLAAVGLVLLVSSGTAAGLMLGEGARRSDELAIRQALGASSPRLVLQLVKESLLLGFAGAVAGLLLAYLGLQLMSAVLPADLPRADTIGIDGRIVGFTMALSVMTTLFFGVGPAVYFARRSSRVIRAGRSTPLASQLRWQHVVVSGQIALCFLLMVGTALLGQSWLSLKNVDAGFSPGNVVAASISIPAGLTPEERRRLASLLASEALSLPGVESVGGVSHLPLTNATQSNSLVLDDTAIPDGNPEAQRREVLPGYFETASIALLEGRLFDAREWEPQDRSILVNHRMATRFWGDASAVGHRIQWDRQWWTIVGVVGDVLQEGLDQPAQATFYVPYAHAPRNRMTLVVKTMPGQHAATQQGLFDAFREINPEIAVTRMTPLESVVADSLAPQRFRAAIACVFSASALLLGIAGVYGVGSRMVTARLKEIGIRMAVGAARRQIVGMVLLKGQALAFAGIAIGTLLSLAAGQWLASFLYGVRPTDVGTYVTVAMGLALVAFGAMLLPARRAARVDPATTLRGD